MPAYNDDYNEEVQRLLLGYLISDPDSFARCRSILRDDYFDDVLRPAVRLILDYADEFHTLPVPEQIGAKTGLLIERFSEVTTQHHKWFLKEIEAFARYKALELAILDGVELLQKGQGGEIERRVKAAMTISLMTDLGTAYFADPKQRLLAMRDHSAFVSTGWRTLDHKLNGGFVRGTLNVFAAGRGVGKSLTLQNLALNWAFAGLHVVYLTMELAENLVSFRLDAMLTGKSTTEIMHDIDDASRAIVLKGAGAGTITVKKLPQAGTTTNMIRAYLKEYEIENGFPPDALLVDYLDLLYPNDHRIDPSNLFIKDKFTSEELRELAFEWNVQSATASQFNRSGVETQEFDHNHIAGGISKIDTADTLIGVRASPQMKERGVFQFQLLKTRTAASVGQQIEMAYDPVCMRITDPANAATDDRPKSTAALKAELHADARIGTRVTTTIGTVSEAAASDPLAGLLAMRERAQGAAGQSASPPK